MKRMRDNRDTIRAGILKAMAHPSRLAMLEALANGERCVCELQALVGSDMSTVSKHLGVLKKAGLVIDRKDGLWVHYRLRVPCVMQFMDCIQALLEQRQEAAVPESARAASKKPAAPCCAP
jgi:DNA-binding transcriptional ArsR family regulator